MIKPKPGDLAIINLVPDQSHYVRSFAGRTCVVLKNLTPADGVFSSPNMWDVLVDDMVIRVHVLDLKLMTADFF